MGKNKSWVEQIIENQKRLEELLQESERLGAAVAQNAADIAAERAKQPLRYKGNVATVSALPSSGEVGDMWNVTSTENNYVWNGSAWDPMAGVLSLPTATTTVSGISKLGSSSTITNGAGVGVNASGQLFVGQGTVSERGVFKLGTETVVSDDAGMVGITSSGALAVRFASASSGGVVKTGGKGISLENNALRINTRANYSGFEFENNAVYINTASTEHPENGQTAPVATDTAGKLCVPDATTTTKGGVQLATSADDTGVTSVLIAAQVKSLLASKVNNNDLTALSGRIHTLETNASSYATNEALQGIVESCNLSISGKADSSSLTALSETVASLEERIAALESA